MLKALRNHLQNLMKRQPWLLINTVLKVMLLELLLFLRCLRIL
jgi:hypothetical protein